MPVALSRRRVHQVRQTTARSAGRIGRIDTSLNIEVSSGRVLLAHEQISLLSFGGLKSGSIGDDSGELFRLIGKNCVIFVWEG